MLGPRKNADQVEPEKAHPHDSHCGTDLAPDMHDVRLPKVIAARRALRANEYDSEAVLDETAQRLTDALGIVRRG